MPLEPTLANDAHYPKTAVLLMAYGTPNSLEEVEPYYTDIRGGRTPTPELLAELKARYQRIGGRTPLTDITRAQANALQQQLGDHYRVYIGMKHWHPYLAQAVGEMARDGRRRVLAIALAPHYSKFSIEGYIQRANDAIEKTHAPLDVTYVKSWNVQPLFLRSIAERMEQARREFDVGWKDIQVVFSAHSLPERILASGDPYPQQLRETAEAVATQLDLPRWQFSFQSAGRTGEKWLGPDILDTLKQIAAEAPKQGAPRRVLIAPIGFVADHLEVLYDIDVQCAELARELGLDMRRIESPNATPTFISALAALVKDEG